MLLRAWLEQQLTTAWYAQKRWVYSLLPLSMLFKVIVAIRCLSYKVGLLKRVTLAVPVIVVGNISVGGTGKTPLVIWLAKALQAQGYTPGVISRGYGSAAISPHIVQSTSDPYLVGDEPLLIARHTACPVVIGKQRVLAAYKLLQHFPHCDVIISDDGLQHYALNRSIEIAVIDSSRRLGNGFCLPAGPLRETASRLHTVDFVVANGQAHSNEYAMHLQPQLFHQVTDPSLQCSATAFSDKTVYAMAGIGNPQRFFQTLQTLGLTIIPLVFPDHYYFQAHDKPFTTEAIIVMTEKDALKCQTWASTNCWYLAVAAHLDHKLLPAILAKLKK